jgi:hypothetical protein
VEEHRLQTCREVLIELAAVLEEQEATFSILGIELSEGTTKALIGLTMSLIVATIAHIEVEVAGE